MRAHELARKLLDGPDLPVVTAHGEMDDLYEISNIEEWPPVGHLHWQKGWFSHHEADWGYLDDPALELS